MRKIAIKYGFIMFVALTLFFLIMEVLGLTQNIWLRLLNGVFQISILYLAIHEYKKTHRFSVGNYLSGIAQGMYTTIIGVIPFAIFVGVFFQLDSTLLAAVRESINLNFFLTPVNIAAFAAVEGIGVGLIGSYIITRLVNMQILKEETGQASVNENYSQNASFSFEE